VASAKTNHLQELAVYVIRPALVEARLMTPKRACDAQYVASLAEELRTVEEKIVALEEAMHLAPEDVTEAPCQAVEGNGSWSADRIRMKSAELDRRLRRIAHPNNSRSAICGPAESPRNLKE
jgi:hypothetical protein